MTTFPYLGFFYVFKFPLMKKIFTLAVCTVVFLSFTADDVKKSPLVGKWRGEDGKEVGFITFDKKGYVTFTIDQQDIGGKQYRSDGIEYDMTYETDDSASPAHLDFVVSTCADGAEISRMSGIYMLIDAKTLVINMKFDGTPRPTEFDAESEDQITLMKVK